MKTKITSRKYDSSKGYEEKMRERRIWWRNNKRDKSQKGEHGGVISGKDQLEN